MLLLFSTAEQTLAGQSESFSLNVANQGPTDLLWSAEQTAASRPDGDMSYRREIKSLAWLGSFKCHFQKNEMSFNFFSLLSFILRVIYELL